MCDTPGCEMVSNFHGFGRDVCWGCYSRMMVSPYRKEDCIVAQKEDLTENNFYVDGTVQLRLDLR